MKNSSQEKPSISYKSHFLSALCRVMFTNTCFIFVNSIFVKTVGGKSYSQLYFIATIFTVSYYVFFAFQGDKKAYGVYKVIAFLAFVASTLCFLESNFTVFNDDGGLLIYFFAVSVMVLDLVGTNIGPVVLQLSVNPAIFREVYQKIVTAELSARIVSAAIVWFLGFNQIINYCYPLAWVTLAVHIVLFNRIVARIPEADIEPNSDQEIDGKLKNLLDSFKFIVSNQMVRIAVNIMIFSYLLKFISDYMFFQIADERFASADQITTFVSAATMAMLLVSLTVQQFFSKKLMRNWQLSTLFSIQPVNVLILGSCALLFSPFWPLVLLAIACNVIHRTIQFPVSKQCLQPIPRSKRATIVSLIYIILSTATLISTGAFSALKDYLHLQDFIVIMFVVAVLVLFLTTGLDSYYIRNLWSFFRESRSGNWQYESLDESISTVPLPTGSIEKLSTDPSAHVDSHPILETYARSYEKDELAAATIDHQKLIKSENPELLIQGLKICFLAGFPWYKDVFKGYFNHQSKEVRKFVRNAAQVNLYFEDFSGFDSIYRRRIKWLMLDTLQREPARIENIKQLLELPNRRESKVLLRTLSDTKYNEYKNTLLNCIDEESEHLNLSPIIELMYSSSFNSGKNFRELLEELTYVIGKEDLASSVEVNLTFLENDNVNLLTKSVNEDPLSLQRFLHTLYLEELRLCPDKLDRTISDTIGEFPQLSGEDCTVFLEMHLEYLKRSRFFPQWRQMMS